MCALEKRLDPWDMYSEMRRDPCRMEVVMLVSSIMPLLALFQVFDGKSSVASGVLRARGKRFIGALLNLSACCIFGQRIPLGVYLTFRHAMGLHGLWIGLTFALIYSAVIGTWISVRTDWNHEVWKVAQRVEEEEITRATENRERENRDRHV